MPFVAAWFCVCCRIERNDDRKPFAGGICASTKAGCCEYGSFTRSTGSCNRSDEQQSLDEPVRRIVRSSGRYATFPPDPLRRYDAIEIRRTWHFGDRLQVLEQGR
jgi:hypothetical protein